MTFFQTKTKKGISVVTYTMNNVGSVAINIILKVGSRHESKQERGISHFLEHMAFKGTRNRTAQDIAIEFDLIGGRFNACTSREDTIYYAKVLSRHAKQAMSILADILQNSVFDSNEISKEFNVISQEIASVNDNPGELAYERLYSLAFPEQPFGRSILGTKQSIAKFDKGTFISYMDRHYTQDNIIVSVAGNVDHKTVLEMVEELFDNIKGPSHSKYLPAIYKGGVEVLEKDLEQTTIVLGFQGPSYMDIEKFYHAVILSVIFGGGLSSRLFQKIREQLGLAYNISSWFNSYSDNGIFSIYAATDHGDANSLIANIETEIDKIKSHITEEELKRAKSQIESNIYMAAEKPEYLSEEIGKDFSIYNRYFSSDEIINIINNIRLEDILSAARGIFSSATTLSVIGRPGDISTNLIKNC